MFFFVNITLPEEELRTVQLLISSDKISVERFCRGEGRMWLYYPYTPGDVVTLSSLELEFAIELLYEGIVFETE